MGMTQESQGGPLNPLFRTGECQSEHLAQRAYLEAQEHKMLNHRYCRDQMGYVIRDLGKQTHTTQQPPFQSHVSFYTTNVHTCYFITPYNSHSSRKTHIGRCQNSPATYSGKNDVTFLGNFAFLAFMLPLRLIETYNRHIY